MPGSRFHNCFYYFRGPSSKRKEAELDKQLEDNTTKALINVLKHSDPKLTTSFLESVVGQTIVPGKEFEYFLQGRPYPPAEAKVLLGLSNRAKIDETSWASASGGSRVDGSIHLPGILTVLIETKVVDALDGSQLQRHALDCGMLGGDRWNIPSEWRIRSWAQVHKWAKQELCTTERQPDKFLLSQLVEYLELAGLAPTWTLRTEHFDFFKQPTEERDGAVAAEIRARLGSIWSRVEEELGAVNFRAVLGEVRVGNLSEGAGHAWAQSNGEASFDLPNLTIEMDSSELNLNVVGGFDRQAECLESWLLNSETSSLSPTGFELAVFCRTAKGGQPGKKIVWQGAAWKKLIDGIPLAELTPTALSKRLAEWRKPLDHRKQRLGFMLRKTWSWDKVIDREDLPAMLAAEIKELLPTLIAIRKMSK